MSVTAAKGFRAAGVAAGIKGSGARDLALVVNDGPDATAAGVFTTNKVKAAPVLWSQRVLRGGVLRAVVLNSGGANACTGAAGLQDTRSMAERAATRLSKGRLLLGTAEVAVCSTGLIGQPLPMPAVLSGVDSAARAVHRDGGPAAAEAIMTTDTRPKTVVVERQGFTVGGMAKGAGMLAPSLATMLCVLTTDAVADSTALDEALRAAAAATFDRVDSDGCTSTNDTVLLLASGASGVTPEPEELAEAVTTACADLATQMLRDAEGATKYVAVRVTGAATDAEALAVARAVARNNLVKTALYGNDPNWGRILAAVGTAEADFDPDAVDVSVNGVRVCQGGTAGEDRSKVDLSGTDVEILVDLHAGDAATTVWTTDLSVAYVHENSAYPT